MGMAASTFTKFAKHLAASDESAFFPCQVPEAAREAISNRWQNRETLVEIARSYNVSHSTMARL